MATSRLPDDKENDYEYHKFMTDANSKGNCWSKICWFLVQIYHYTIGSCCYTPMRWLCTALFYCCCCCQNDINHGCKEMTECEILLKTKTLPEHVDKNKWKRATLIDIADQRMKERLRHQFQDHIQKWMDRNHRRFPWKLVLHLLLVVSVTVQVS